MSDPSPKWSWRRIARYEVLLWAFLTAVVSFGYYAILWELVPVERSWLPYCAVGSWVFIALMVYSYKRHWHGKL